LSDTRSDLAMREQRLRVAGGNQVELAVVVQLADRIQRMAALGGSERERRLELRALRLGRTASCQQPVRMLPGDTKLSRQT
jgi:hypothetical protein